MPVCPIRIPLSNGAFMPALGLGTSSKSPRGKALLEAALDKALETGYRHIDTASVYANEKIVGNVLKRWLDSGKIRREELFIVTKLPCSRKQGSEVERFLKTSLANLQLDYVDLYMVHTPVGFADLEGHVDLSLGGKPVLDKRTDIIATWKGMEAQVDAGLAKAIGLANFNEKQIQRILNAARIKPAVLQVELHLYFQQFLLVEFCHKNNINVTAYAPLGSPGMAEIMRKYNRKFIISNPLINETVVSIAKKHQKSPAQVLIRHTLQRGVAAVPKSANPERVVSNFQVFDFELDQGDVEALNKLDKGPNARGFDFKLYGFEDHPDYPF